MRIRASTSRLAYDNAHFVNILFHNVWEELAIAIGLDPASP